jgi:glycosyltransferase involved in cell wall biosynthesis
MDNPLVSVVVATYNRSNLLEKCLLSILDQTYPHDLFEVTIVDDGSSDDTREVVQNLAKTVEYPKIHYLYQQNSGPGAARNMGINNSKGEIIAFIDDDAVASKDWLENALPYFTKESVAGVEGIIYVRDSQNIPFLGDGSGKKYATGNIFYRSFVLKQIGGFDPNFYDGFHFREDSDLAFSIIEKGYEIVFAKNVIVIHPKIEPSFSAMLKFAKRYYFDPLLYKKHKFMYKSLLENRKIGWFHIKRAYHYTCLSNILAILTFILSIIIIQNTFLSLISSLFYIFTLLALAHKFTHFKFSLVTNLNIFWALLVTPFVYLYWLIKGSFRFKSFIW